MLFVLLGLASLNVYANGCGGEYQPATGTCRIIDSSGRQILYNVGRPQSSNSGSTQPKIINIDVPSKYLALAVNIKTEKEAIRTCERGGSNAPCVIAASVRNGCVAVAQGTSGKKLKTFYGMEAPGLAEPKALNKCNAAGALKCKIVVNEACSMPRF